MSDLVRMSDAPRQPLPAPLDLLAAPLAWAYGVGVRYRNARFDRGVGIGSLPVPVVSVGNITAGGTGKTPFVAWVATALAARGHRPLIAMRGYRAAPGEAGDEELEYRSLLPEVPVVANPQRLEAVGRHLARAAPERMPDVVLLDDGFQHRQVRRDLDVVLVDATRPGLGDRLLPSGWLREPAAGLRRASAVIVTRAEEMNEALGREIARLHGRAPLAWTRHAWRAVTLHGADGESRSPLSWLRGKRLTSFCGVGNPRSVLATATGFGATIAADLPARDHVAITVETIRRIVAAARGSDGMLLTRKDWVKVAALRDGAARAIFADAPPVVVPDMAIEFIDGEEAVIAALRNAIAKPVL